jgi:hypothetical protein
VRIRIRRLPLPVALVLLVAACGGQASKTSTHAVVAPSKTGTPPGMIVHRVPEQRFSIALPRRWRVVDASSLANDPRLEKLAADNPEFADELRALAHPGSPLKLLALDTHESGGYRTTMNITTQQVSREMTTATLKKELGRTLSVRNAIDPVLVELGFPTGPTVWASFKIRVHARQLQSVVTADNLYAVKHGTTVYYLTYVASPKLEPGLEKTFTDSARTFRVGG